MPCSISLAIRHSSCFRCLRWARLVGFSEVGGGILIVRANRIYDVLVKWKVAQSSSLLSRTLLLEIRPMSGTLLLYAHTCTVLFSSKRFLSRRGLYYCYLLLEYSCLLVSTREQMQRYVACAGILGDD
jgi:hypothetical protein